MNILITGGAGYIGSILTPILLNAGHRVTVLDSFLYKENSLAHVGWNQPFDVYRVDCRDTEAVKPYLKGKDVIIPLAGLVGVPLGNLNPIDAELINLKAPLALFKDAPRNALIVMPTTESSYGSNADVCTETTPLNPLSTYAHHKVIVENALLERGNAVSLRLATVFGMSPRHRLDLLVNDFVWRAIRDRAMVIFEGKYRRTCVHVSDVSRAFLHVIGPAISAHSPVVPEGIYNVGACTMTKLSLCDAIQKQIPNFVYTEAPIDKDPDQRDYIVSDEKIRATGYQPLVTLEAGIRELVKGYRMLANNRYSNVP